MQSVGERSGQLIMAAVPAVAGAWGRGKAAMGKEDAGDVMQLYKAMILNWKG